MSPSIGCHIFLILIASDWLHSLFRFRVAFKLNGNKRLVHILFQFKSVSACAPLLVSSKKPATVYCKIKMMTSFDYESYGELNFLRT